MHSTSSVSKEFITIYKQEIARGQSTNFHGTALHNRIIEKIFAYHIIQEIEKSGLTIKSVGRENIATSNHRHISRIHALEISDTTGKMHILMDAGGLGGTKVVFKKKGHADMYLHTYKTLDGAPSTAPSIKLMPYKTKENEISNYQVGLNVF